MAILIDQGNTSEVMKKTITVRGIQRVTMIAEINMIENDTIKIDMIEIGTVVVEETIIANEVEVPCDHDIVEKNKKLRHINFNSCLTNFVP